MAEKAILTSRELKNKVTGIDLMVPEFTEKVGKFSKSAVFNVIVVTRLFYYKSQNHKESDVVQFMIQRTYEQFEHLYEKLSNRFPSVLFPALPKKSLIVSTAVQVERKRVLEELMQLVARTQKLCCSPMVLEFLGVKGREKSTPETLVVSEEVFNEQLDEQLHSQPSDETAGDQNGRSTSKEDKSQEEQGDLFVPVDLDSSNLSDIANQDDVFAVSNSKKLELHASLFEDEIETTKGKDEADLFLPATRGQLLKESEKELHDDEDPDDLLSVEESVDDLLALSKKSERKSSIKASTSARPLVKSRSQQRASFEGGAEDDDLALLSTSKAKKELPKADDEDLFVEARTKDKTTKREKREKEVEHHTLDDIFGKSKGDKNLFAKAHVDDDLFSSSPTAKSNTTSTLEQDDIAKYINDNTNTETDDLGL